MELTSRMMDGSIPFPPNDRGDDLEPGGRMTQDAKAEFLQRVPILAGCSKRQLRSISRIADVLELPTGQVLARAGEAGDRFFFIVDGAVRVEVSPDKHHRVGPGEFFGEMSLLDGEPRSATVVADTAVRLLVVHRRDFWGLLKEVPALTERILVTLCRRVRQAENALNA